MGPITERFIWLYKSLNLTGTLMERECKGNVITKQKISHIETGRTEVSLDIIAAFVCCYKNTSIEWLVTGNGKPFKEEPKKEDENGEKATEKYYQSLIKTRDELFSVQIDYIFQSMKSNNVSIENLVRDVADIKNKIDLIIGILSNQSQEKGKAKSA